MIEQVFQMTMNESRIAERVIVDENLHYMHIVLPAGESLPEHDSNATTYLSVLHGTLTIGLSGQQTHEYPAGTIVKIPLGTKMNIQNVYGEVLEMTVVKAPAPTL